MWGMRGALTGPSPAACGATALVVHGSNARGSRRVAEHGEPAGSRDQERWDQYGADRLGALVTAPERFAMRRGSEAVGNARPIRAHRCLRPPRLRAMRDPTSAHRPKPLDARRGHPRVDPVRARARICPLPVPQKGTRYRRRGLEPQRTPTNALWLASSSPSGLPRARSRRAALDAEWRTGQEEKPRRLRRSAAATVPFLIKPA
jgi:hypothetical protein